MSGVYIKGVEMPSCCLVCPCSGADNTDDGNEVWVCEASKCVSSQQKIKLSAAPNGVLSLKSSRMGG